MLTDWLRSTLPEQRRLVMAEVAIEQGLDAEWVLEELVQDVKLSGTRRRAASALQGVRTGKDPRN